MTGAPAPELVITGLGVVSAAGAGRDPAIADLAEPTVRLTEVDRTGGYHRPGGARMAVAARSVPLTTWLSPLAARRMSPASRMTVACARMAVAEAGLTETFPADAAVVTATSYGAAEVSEKILRQILLDSPESVSPALFTESVANAPAAQMALAFGAEGANLTITQRQAGPWIGLERAAAELHAGRTPAVLVGVVDELNPLLHAALDRFGALAHGAGGEAARPFDRDRRGWLAGEGAAVAVLETATAAESRGARALARLVAAGTVFDPSAAATGFGREPERAAADIAGAWAATGIEPAAVDLVVSSACGSPAGDHYEARLLAHLLGRCDLPVVCPKAWLGEHGAALLSSAVLLAAGHPAGPTPGFASPDPGCAGIEPWTGATSPPPRAHAVASTWPGGAVSWAVLEPAP